MLDLLIIGMGLTGLAAGLAAGRAGLRTHIIAKGLGAQHWSAGTLDLLGYQDQATPVTAPWSAIEQLDAAHPLRRISTADARAAIDAFCRELDEAGLPYAGSDDGESNVWLPTIVGSARPAWRVPAAQLGGRLDDPAPMLLVGFEGMRDFYPALAAENLTKQGHPARSAMLPMTLLTRRYESPPPVLASEVEEPSTRRALAAALRDLVAPGERIGLPALLGLDGHPQTWLALQEETGAPIFEIPTLPPSVPGMRLHRALVHKLTRLGVRIHSNMAVESIHAENGTIQWVATSTPARPLRHSARAYLLATGGILGGGFATDHTGGCREVVFDLPLTTPQDRAAWFEPHFLTPKGHPIFTGGVAVNDAWQPCTPDGTPVYRNLWAAGNLLAHADTIQTRSREGVAIITATAAVQALAAQDALRPNRAS